MKYLFSRPVQTTVSLVCAGLLATGGLAFGQDPGQPSTTQSAPANPGGWRRVGDPPPASAANSYPADPANQMPAYPADQNAAPYPANPNAAPYPSSQAPAPSPNYGGQQPYPQGPSYGQQPPQQQPAGQFPNYNQAPAPPVPAQLAVPAGTFVTVRVNQLISTDRNQPGDAFSATLVQPLVVNGVVIAEPGQTIAGRVVESVKAGRVEGVARLKIQLTELTLADGQQVPVQSQLISRKGDTSIGRDAGAIGTTTALGAAIGAAAGWGTGAAIGAGAGAAAGTLGVLLTRGHPSVIYPEQELTFRLEAPFTVSTSIAPQAFHYVQPGEYDRPTYAGNPGPGPGYYGAPAPAPAPYAYPAYGYPYYYPYWGPSFAFYAGPSFWFGRGYYGRGFYGGRGFYRR